MKAWIPVPLAAERANVARNTMHRAAKSGAIKAMKLGRDWLIYEPDIPRWKGEVYQPGMARRYPVNPEKQEGSE